MRFDTRIAVLAAWCFFTVACCSTGGAPGQPEPGTQYYAMAPENITEVVFSSSERKLYGYRWNASEPFNIYTAGRGANPELCTSGGEFTRWLNAVATIPVQAVAKNTIAGEWIEVQLRDVTTLEPNTANLLIPLSQTDPVLMRYGDQQYVVEVNAVELRSVNSGCAALGAAK